MFNAHISHIKEVFNAKFPGKIPAFLTLLGRFDVLVGGKVVQHQVYPALIEYMVKALSPEYIHRHCSGDVVAQHLVQPGADELARLDGIQPGVGGQDLLRHGHSHGNLSFIFGILSGCSRR